ncbi:flagellar hook-length control protein FliK [Methylomarinum vadi]|uniref:flagellar hook-length control protein FliK n=1 Tax=Methylomarinum vadi TaxID=438855 RepID=UPI0004DF88AF|nr:flagellar hook-length control protein FliK [Methylomarinum vadi]
MEIKLPLPVNTLGTAKSKLDALTLQLNQQLEVKVIEAKSEQNTLTLQFANTTLRLQSNQPLAIKPGQALMLQVVRLQPAPEFQIVKPTQPTTQAATEPLQNEIILKQLQPSPAPQQTTQLTKQLVTGQLVAFKIAGITANSLSGLLYIDGENKASTRPPLPATLPVKQIVNLGVSSGQRNDNQALTLKNGQWLTLEVVKPGDQPQFKLVTYPERAISDRAITEAIKQYLPIQDSATTLLNSLSNLEGETEVPQLLQRLAREILQSLPQRSQLTDADSLKHHIENSGRLFEAKLIQLATLPDINLKDDFKLKLLQLINQLQQQTDPTPEQKPKANELNLLREILQKSHATLAKTILDQLASLPREDGNKLNWSLELPFFNQKHIDKIAIQIEQEKTATSKQAKNTWAVTMTLTPPGLGTLHCKLHCFDNIVSTRFWSDQTSTVEKIKHHLDYLRQELENNGINPGLIEVQQGHPQQTTDSHLSVRNLLNEEV